MKQASRGFTSKRRFEDIFYLFAYEVNDLSHLVVSDPRFDHIRNDKCPNDSRRIMQFVASVPFWFLAGKYALENSSIVYRVPLGIFLFQ